MSVETKKAKPELTRDLVRRIESDEKCYFHALQVEFQMCQRPDDKMPKHLDMAKRVERRVQPTLARCRQRQHERQKAGEPHLTLMPVILEVITAAEIEPLGANETEGDRAQFMIYLRVVRYLYMETQSRKALRT